MNQWVIDAPQIKVFVLDYSLSIANNHQVTSWLSIYAIDHWLVMPGKVNALQPLLQLGFLLSNARAHAALSLKEESKASVLVLFVRH